MGTDCEAGSLSSLLQAAKQAPSSSEERRQIARKILKTIALRTELFRLATSSDLKQRLRSRNDVVWLMQGSGNLRRDFGVDPEIYQEALARTWEWFGHSFEKYRPERASFITWFNMKLSFTVIDIQNEVTEETQRRPKPVLDGATGQVIDPLSLIQDTRQDPELTAELSSLVEQVQNWLEQQQGPLSRKHVPQYPQANCYIILSSLLPTRSAEHDSWQPGKTFSELAGSLNVAEAALKRCFRTKCWPSLNDFLHKQGFC